MQSVIASTHLSRQAEAPTSAGNQLGGGSAFVDGPGVNASSGAGPGPEGLRACNPHPTDNQPIPAPSEAEEAPWKQVTGKRRKKGRVDVSSAIIWNVPKMADAGVLGEVLGKFTKIKMCYWRGSGDHRHMVVEFGSPVHKMAVGERLQEECSKIGLKMMLKTRDFATRSRHRKARNPEGSVGVQPPSTEVGNRYNNLKVEEGSLRRKKLGSRARRRRRDRAASEVNKLLKRQDRSFKVGSINVQGALADKIAELEEYLGRGKYDLVAIQETQLGAKKIDAKGYRVFCQDDKFRGSTNGGVLFLVAEHLAPAVSKEVCSFADQLWIRITGTDNRNDLLVCSAYMPQESDSKQVREDAFGALAASTNKFRAGSADVVIMGDFNARVGTPKTPEEETFIGRFGQQGERTPNWQLLVTLLKDAKMSNLGGQVPPPVRKEAAPPGTDFWFTRMDKKNGTKNTIDFIAASDTLTQWHSKFWVDYTHLWTDHHLLGACIMCPRVIARRRGRKKATRRFRLDKMIQTSSKSKVVEAVKTEREGYQKCLAEAFEGYQPDIQLEGKCACSLDSCVCAGVEDFVQRTCVALERSVGSKVSGGKCTSGWFDGEVKTVIKERRAAYEHFLETGSKEDWNKFRALRARCKRLVKQKKKEDWDKFMGRIEDAFENDHRKLWQLVQRLTPTGNKVTLAPVRNKKGILAKSEEQILETWAEHQEFLGTPKAHELEDKRFAESTKEEVLVLSEISQHIGASDIDRDFDDEGIEAGIEALKYHKAAAEDGTRNPMYKCGGGEMVKHLSKLFNHLKKVEKTPASWQRSVVVNLFKEGDKTEPGNYRGIALISCLGKLYLSLWARRLAEYAETKLTDGQGGFRRHRSTVDQAVALHEVLLRRRKKGQTSYTCFIDFRKAFATVWHEGLWKRLWDSGIRGKAWRVVKSLYSSVHAQVQVGDKKTRSVRMRQGVRQGCPLSPILFNYFVDELSRKLSQSGYGVEAGEAFLHSLLYADDVVLVADTASELQGAHRRGRQVLQAVAHGHQRQEIGGYGGRG